MTFDQPPTLHDLAALHALQALITSKDKGKSYIKEVKFNGELKLGHIYIDALGEKHKMIRFVPDPLVRDVGDYFIADTDFRYNPNGRHYDWDNNRNIAYELKEDEEAVTSNQINKAFEYADEFVRQKHERIKCDE